MVFAILPRCSARDIALAGSFTCAIGREASPHNHVPALVPMSSTPCPSRGSAIPPRFAALIPLAMMRF